MTGSFSRQPTSPRHPAPTPGRGGGADDGAGRAPYHAGMRRRTCLVSGALLACGMGAARAAPAFEGTGTWLATAGPADNRARVGLELGARRGRRAAARCYTIDLLNFFGAVPAAAGARPPTAAGACRRTSSEVRHAGDTPAGDRPDRRPRSRCDAAPRCPQPPARPPAPRWPRPALDGSGWAARSSRAPAVARRPRVRRQRRRRDVRGGHARRPAWPGATPPAGRSTARRPSTDDAVFFACDNGWLVRLDRASGKEALALRARRRRASRACCRIPFVFDYDHAAPRPVLRRRRALRRRRRRQPARGRRRAAARASGASQAEGKVRSERGGARRHAGSCSARSANTHLPASTAPAARERLALEDGRAGHEHAGLQPASTSSSAIAAAG